MSSSKPSAYVLQNKGYWETIPLAVCQTVELHHYLHQVWSNPKFNKLPSVVVVADSKDITLTTGIDTHVSHVGLVLLFFFQIKVISYVCLGADMCDACIKLKRFRIESSFRVHSSTNRNIWRQLCVEFKNLTLAFYKQYLRPMERVSVIYATMIRKIQAFKSHVTQRFASKWFWLPRGLHRKLTDYVFYHHGEIFFCTRFHYK